MPSADKSSGQVHVSLVESLIGAIVRLDGDSLVLHTAEKPYVITSSSAMNAFRGPLAWGQVELSTRLLTTEAVLSMLDQMLTHDQRRVLDELGAVENQLPSTDDRPAFRVIAARGGEDIWVEIRPVRPKPIVEPVPEYTLPSEGEVPEPQAIASVPPPALPAPAITPPSAAAPEAPLPFELVPDVEQEDLNEDEVAQLLELSGLVGDSAPDVVIHHADDEDALPLMVEGDEWSEPGPEEISFDAAREETARLDAARIEAAREEAARHEAELASLEAARAGELASLEAAHAEEVARREAAHAEELGRLEAARAEERARMEADRAEELARVEAARAEEAARLEEARAELGRLEAARLEEEARVEAARAVQREEASRPAEEPEPEIKIEPRPAVIVPLERMPRDQPPASPAAATPDIDRLLSLAAARGASGLYLVSRSVPAVRVDGEMRRLEGEEALGPSDVEAFMLALSPEPNHDAVKSGETFEWFCDVAEAGRVRCLGFHDHRGPGLIVRMLPARAISAEQLGLSQDIQSLCAQPDGLVLVTGPRASGTSTLIAAFVDLVNRTRADHVISIERQITFVHESRRSFVSQREVRGDAPEVLAAVRAALREDPDVLVVEELRSPEVIATVLEAAESGVFVLAGFRAPAAGQAVERLIDHLPAERRNLALASLSTGLRAVVGQVLLRKRGGGRVAARELLINTHAAASVIAEGKLFQLTAALESGRKLGSLPLNDSLAALIRDGIVDAGEAWRKAYDREGLLALLRREGIDTAFVERLA